MVLHGSETAKGLLIVQLIQEHPELNCAKCGSCTVVCPVFRVDRRESMTARGKMHLLSTPLADRHSSLFEDLLAKCLLCGACEQVCPRNLPITDIVSRARSRFSFLYGPGGLQKTAARTVLARPGLVEGLVRAGITLKRMERLPLHSGLRLKLGLLETRQVQIFQDTANQAESGADLQYFSGCLARHLQPSVGRATNTLLNHCGHSASAPDAQSCCGLAAWSAGKRDQARALARKNIQAFSSADGPIITSCASCSSHLLAYPDLFLRDDPWYERACSFAERVQEFTAYFASCLSAAQPDFPDQQRVFYHDPCHLRFQPEGRETPRRLIRAMGLILVEPEDGPSCCGQGGLFHLGYAETSARVFQEPRRKALAAEPDCITTTCSGCLMQYQQGIAESGDQVRVAHLAVLLAEILPEKQTGQAVSCPCAACQTRQV
jgi:glycolate oxidase iron-sulfur subunit